MMKKKNMQWKIDISLFHEYTLLLYSSGMRCDIKKLLSWQYSPCIEGKKQLSEVSAWAVLGSVDEAEPSLRS